MSLSSHSQRNRNEYMCAQAAPFSLSPQQWASCQRIAQHLQDRMREEVESQGGRRGNIQYGTVGLKKEQRTMQLMKNVRQTESSRTGRESRHTQLISNCPIQHTHTQRKKQIGKQHTHLLTFTGKQTFSLSHTFRKKQQQHVSEVPSGSEPAVDVFVSAFGLRGCYRVQLRSLLLQ